MSSILSPLYDVVSWIMVVFHKVFTPVFGTSSGVTWSLSIIGLVVVIRILLIPLFVKQIKSQRGLQLLQPEIKKLQDKHKGDREKQSQELMKLYKETGTNPLSSCLPILVQAPIFYALFHVLRGIAQEPVKPAGILTQAQAESAAAAHFFGARLSESFTSTTSTSTRVVTILMIVAMSLSQFITQRQLMVKNVSAESAAANPLAQQQKLLLYVFPIMFAVFGINFPVGVLLYWLTTNLWSMGQQFYVIRNMPSPGTPAEAAYLARMAAKQSAGRRSLLRRAPAASTDSASGAPGGPPTPAAPAAPRGQRQQPSRSTKRNRPTGGGTAAKPSSPARPPGGSTPAAGPAPGPSDAG